MDLLALLPLLLFAGAVYLAWPSLRRLLPEGAHKTRVAGSPGAEPAPLTGDGQFRLNVAGCAHHRDNFMHLFGGQIARELAASESISEGDTVTHDVAATLVLDDANIHDSNAVEVQILGRRVGYLPQSMAPHFRTYLARQGLKGRSFRCLAQADLPLHLSDDFEVRLDIPQIKP